MTRLVKKNTDLTPSLIITDKACLEKTGKALYKKNKNLRALANMVQHPEFQEFFRLYFSSEEDIRCVVKLITLYNRFSFHPDTCDLNPYQKLALMNSLLFNREFRSTYFRGDTKTPRKNTIHKIPHIQR